MPRGSCWLDGAAKGEPPAGGTKVGVAKGICVVCWPGCCIKGATPAMGEVPITGIDPIIGAAPIIDGEPIRGEGPVMGTETVGPIMGPFTGAAAGNVAPEGEKAAGAAGWANGC